MAKQLKDYDWDMIRDALSAYADHLEDTEPHAFNTIATFRDAVDNCPMEDELL